jgi:hypothetical protein
MNLDSLNKNRATADNLRIEDSSARTDEIEQPSANFVEQTPEKLSFESLISRTGSVFGEMFKLENVPFVVLFALATASLISRVWLMRQ